MTHVADERLIEVAVDYFCDPHPGNNSMRLDLDEGSTPPASDDARLFSLTSSVGYLAPAFSPELHDYLFEVAPGVSSIRFTPFAMDPAATIRINGVAVASGSISQPVLLTTGMNPIVISVLAADGLQSRTYELEALRIPAPNLSMSCTPVQAGLPGDLGTEHGLELQITNIGEQAPLDALRVSSPSPAALLAAQWQCDGPVRCDPPSGSGSLNAVLPYLGPGESIVAVASGSVSPVVAFLDWHANVSTPDGSVHAECGLSIPVNGIGILRNGFER